MKKIFAANITVIGDSSYLLGFYSDYLQPCNGDNTLCLLEYKKCTT